MSPLVYAKKFLSHRGWGIIRYNSIWQNFSALFFLLLDRQRYDFSVIFEMFWFVLFSTFMAVYGYFVNDLGDIELDRLHNKANAFQNIPKTRAVGIVLCVLALGMGAAWPFYRLNGFWLIWLCWWLAATFYSLPPLRLKTRGFVGLMTTILAQQVLPMWLVFAVFGEVFSIPALVFALYAFVRGFSSDLAHQIRDWPNDITTKTTTFAVRFGQRPSQWLYAINLEVERLMIGSMLTLLLVSLPPIHIFGFSPAMIWPVLAIYLLLLSRTAGRSLGACAKGRLMQQDPYDEIRQSKTRDAFLMIHHTLPTVLTPLWIGIQLAWSYWPYLLLEAFLLFPYMLGIRQRLTLFRRALLERFA